jgi:hypothetical protein
MISNTHLTANCRKHLIALLATFRAFLSLRNVFIFLRADLSDLMEAFPQVKQLGLEIRIVHQEDPEELVLDPYLKKRKFS